MMKRKAGLWIFIFSSLTGISQQVIHTQQIDNSSGLSNSCVATVFQDKDRLLWVGTWDGLNVYDGANFSVFNYGKHPGKENIASNIIYGVAEGKNSEVWIATIEGITRIHKNTGNISNYFYDKTARVKSVGKGYLIGIDKQGNVFAAAKGEKNIYLFDEAVQNFKICQIDGIEQGEINKFFFDDNNRLWLLKSNGILDVFRMKDKTLFREFRYNELKEITDIFYINQEIFYTTSDNRLFKSKKQVVFEQVALLPKALRCITFYRGHYLLGWSSTGLAKYTQDFKETEPLPQEYDKLQNIRVTSLLNSNDEMLWIGSDGKGLIKITEKNNTFGTVQRLPNGESMNIPVRAFCQVDNELWVGTKGDGIVAISNLGGTQSAIRYHKIFRATSDLMDNCVYSIIKGNDGYIYIGSDATGITVYDPRQKRFISWNQMEGNQNLPPFRSVHSILPDSDSSVWLGTETFGLIKIRLRKTANGGLSIQEFEQYKFTGDYRGPANDIIYSLARGKDNRIWVGCRYGGLSLFNKKSKRFSTYKAFSYDGALSNNDILSLHLDKKQRIWIGTSFGLNWMPEAEGNKAQPVFEKMSQADGLPNNTIHGIVEDEKGDIWISTNKGLARIDPGTKKIQHYKETDGLQSNEFSDNAVFKNENGQLFFGGIYGFNYFHPEKIIQNKERPYLLLSDIQMAGMVQQKNSLIVLNHDEKKPTNFELSPKENFFEIRVKAITYSNQGKVSYAYFLEGYDKVWNYIRDDNRIAYSELPPGNFKLLVKWTNGDGLWSKPATALELTVKQYIWLTLPAFIIYSLLFGAGLYLLYRYQRNKELMKRRLDLEHMLRKKDEEVHLEQLNFFTNIAHELQTPLALISSALERFFAKTNQQKKSIPHQHFLQIVNQQSSRLSYLIHQLLEFRKAESGYLKNNYSRLNVSQLFSNIAALFTPVAEQKSMVFEYHNDEVIETWTDRDKLEKIIFNLISNAFKHAPNDEQVFCYVKSDKEKDTWEVVVANSGCSLTAEDCKRLFSKFFIVKDTNQQKISSGIGLAFTRELVGMLNGEINVELNKGWIHFKATFPLSYIPQKEEISDNAEKQEAPSYLIESMASNQQSIEKTQTEENNKKALMESLENENRKSILIIEDEPVLRFLLNDLLKEKYIIYEAGNGKDALQLMTRIVPDLIISDIMMPDMDGLEVCHIVKNTPATCHIPLIMLTARGQEHQKVEGYEAGADAYITKPFNTEHLLVRVRKLMEYQHKLHEMFKQEGVAENLPASGMKEEDRQFLKRAMDLISENLDKDDLDSTFLEKQLNMSKAHFYRRIKAMSGMTPGELIKNIRLEEAAKLLKTSDFTVLEIFYRTGFNNQSHFFREFKKKYHASPNDYRSSFHLNINKNSS